MHPRTLWRDAMRRQQGFTLIELMLALVIVAVLLMIAIPTYKRYVYRVRRAEGHSLLMGIAQAEERYYTSFNAYTSDLTKLGYRSEHPQSQHGYYAAEVSLTDGSSAGSAYLAKAVPQNAQAGDACGTLSIDDSGDEQPDASHADANSNGRCW